MCLIHSVDDIVVCLGDTIEIVGRYIDAFLCIHSDHGAIERRLIRKNVAIFCCWKELSVKYTICHEGKEGGAT